MDQEAEIMKQSMARQEAAQEAVQEEEAGGTLRTVSSGARGKILGHVNFFVDYIWCLKQRLEKFAAFCID